MILGAYGLYIIWNAVKRKKNKPLTFVILILFSVGIIYPIYINQIRNIGTIKRAREYLHYPIFGYVKEKTDVNDRIFFWGVFADIYTFTNRVPASGCVLIQRVLGWRWAFPKPAFSGEVPRISRRFMNVMKKKPPKLVIVPTNVDPKNEPARLYDHILWPTRFTPLHMNKIPSLWEFVQKNYYLKEHFDGFAIYELKSKENGTANND